MLPQATHDKLLCSADLLTDTSDLALFEIKNIIPSYSLVQKNTIYNQIVHLGAICNFKVLFI